MTIFIISLIAVLVLLLLCLLALLLFSYVKFEVKYKNDLTVSMKILFYKISIYPSREKKHKKRKKEQKAVKKDIAKSEGFLHRLIKKKGYAGAFSLLSKAVKPTLRTVRDFLRKCIIDNLKLHLVIASEDAAQSALEYGQVCAVLYPLLGAIYTNFGCKNIDTSITVDYTEHKADIDFLLRFRFKIIHALRAGINFNEIIRRLKASIKDTERK